MHISAKNWPEKNWIGASILGEVADALQLILSKLDAQATFLRLLNRLENGQ